MNPEITFDSDEYSVCLRRLVMLYGAIFFCLCLLSWEC